MKLYTVLFLLVLAGCSKGSGDESGASATQPGKTAGAPAVKSINESKRDANIENWQSKVLPTPECAEFKERFETVGRRHESIGNAAYLGDVVAIWAATKAAQCAASQ